MLPPEPAVVLSRYAFADAQAAITGGPVALGTVEVSWYGTDVDDDRGCFAIVDPNGPLSAKVGDFLLVEYQGRSVKVYVIGSYSLLPTPLALARRAYFAISLLAVEPILAAVAVLL